MLVRSFTGGDFLENAYIVTCEATGQVVVVDPGAAAPEIVDALADDAASVAAILLTHAHLDHVEGLEAIRAITDAPTHLHAADRPMFDDMPAQAAMFGLSSPALDPPEREPMGRLGSHPHIVTVFDLGEDVGQPYMVTELMGGGDVEGVIEDATDHKLSLEQAIAITRETCRGLEFAHSRGIVHRDLKPGNVWLTAPSAGSGQAYGVAKIGDFGLAVAIDRSRLTTEGMMVGTPTLTLHPHVLLAP